MEGRDSAGEVQEKKGVRVVEEAERERETAAAARWSGGTSTTVARWRKGSELGRAVGEAAQGRRDARVN